MNTCKTEKTALLIAILLALLLLIAEAACSKIPTSPTPVVEETPIEAPAPDPLPPVGEVPWYEGCRLWPELTRPVCPPKPEPPPNPCGGCEGKGDPSPVPSPAPKPPSGRPDPPSRPQPPRGDW